MIAYRLGAELWAGDPTGLVFSRFVASSPNNDVSLHRLSGDGTKVAWVGSWTATIHLTALDGSGDQTIEPMALLSASVGLDHAGRRVVFDSDANISSPARTRTGRLKSSCGRTAQE